MRKIYLTFVILAMLVIAGCSNGEHAGSSEQSGGAAPEQSTKGNAEKENKKDEPKLEIIDSTSAAWKDSIGTIWVHASAVYKNTGTTAIDIGETQINYKAQDGSIMGTSTMVYSTPEIIQPGETAYITESTILDGTTDAAEFKEVSFNFGFDKTSEDGKILETSGVKGIVGDSFIPYKVTGLVTNTTDAKQDDIRIAAALLDAEGKLLGVLKGSVDVGLNPGGEAGFELTYPDLPAEIVPNIATVEVKAFAWTW